jgi:hypothetical protein
MRAEHMAGMLGECISRKVFSLTLLSPKSGIPQNMVILRNKEDAICDFIYVATYTFCTFNTAFPFINIPNTM